MSVYIVWVRTVGIFSYRTLEGVYGSKEAADEARIKILVSIANGPDDVTVQKFEVQGVVE